MLLTLAIFLPTLTAIIAVLIPAENRNAVRVTCTLGAILTFAVVTAVAVDYGDPKTQEDTGLLPTFERLVDGGIARAVPVAQDADSLEPDQQKWLEDDQPWSAHRANLERSNIYENDWNRLRLRHRLAAMLREGQTFQEARPNTDAMALFKNAEDRPQIDQETYDRLLALELAQQSEQAQHVRYVEHKEWIPAFRINYFLGVDGLSVPLVWLTAFLTILCLVYSWYMNTGTKAFYILFMIMETGLIGVFCALDFFLFYVFWEIVLLPMYFLIGVWGGPRRIYAAIKFFIYTLVGSVLMLIAMLTLYNNVEPFSFNMLTLMKTAPTLVHSTQMWLFGALFIGFAIKVPVFPFHTWLPDAHVEAPTAGSMILAGVLLKMGGYGFFRIAYPMLPNAATSDFFIWLVASLGTINIVYGALAAMAQRDFKSLVAYSSISHMGYILLGLAAGTVAGYTGGVMQMFNHGISSAMMFCLVGCIQNRIKHRNLDDMGGFALQMPYFSGLAIIAFFAALGLPGLNGFISEALTFLGCFEAGSNFMNPVDVPLRFWHVETIRPLVYISLTGVLLTAAYILWSIQRVFLGTTPEKYKTQPDINLRESVSLIPLAALCIILGVFPSILIGFMDPSIQSIVQVVSDGAAQVSGIAAR